MLPEIQHGPGERVRNNERNRQIGFSVQYDFSSDALLREKRRRVRRALRRVRRYQAMLALGEPKRCVTSGSG